MGGWLDVTRRCCIKTAKPILNLFRPSGSPIILVFLTPAPIPNYKGNPFSRGIKYIGVEKLAIFDGNRRLTRKWCDIGRWLLWNTKSWVLDWMVSFSMTLSDCDPQPGSRGHCTPCFIKKTTPYLIAHNFGKCWSIFKKFSPSDSAEIV